MFNFFNEVKQGVKDFQFTGGYNLVNISGKVVYVEGHKGIVTISKELMIFKVKDGRITIQGKDMILAELSENTLKISGIIKIVEAY